MNKEDVLQFLKDNFYLISDSGSNVVTSKFFRDFGVRATDAKDSDSIKPTRTSRSSLTTEDYSKFIEDAEVPTFIANGQGGKFYANRVSKKGFEAFKVASAKTDEKVLLAACKWYYKQQNTSKVMIGTWFADDIWISCVRDIQRALDKKGALPKIEEESSNMERG